MSELTYRCQWSNPMNESNTWIGDNKIFPRIWVDREKKNLGVLRPVSRTKHTWMLCRTLQETLFGETLRRNTIRSPLNTLLHKLQSAEDYNQSIKKGIVFEKETDFRRTVGSGIIARHNTYDCKSHIVIHNNRCVGRIHTTSLHHDPYYARSYDPSWMFCKTLSEAMKIPYIEPGYNHHMSFQSCKQIARIRLHESSGDELIGLDWTLALMVSVIFRDKAREIMEMSERDHIPRYKITGTETNP